MINAYPSIMAVNRYQTHKDYYRVGAVSAVSGGKTNTIRRMLDLPYEELAYKQFAQAAAKDVSQFVKSAQTVKQSAQTLITTSSNLTSNSTALPASSSAEDQQAALTQKIQDFIQTYNDFQDQLVGTPDLVNSAFLQGLEVAAKPLSLKQLGITKQDTGQLGLDVDTLVGQMKSQVSAVSTSLNHLTSFASSLVNTINRMQQLPSASFFQLSSSPLKPYGQYQSQLQSYLPVPMRGILLDAKM
ncbi:hypothetical protein A8709_08725 [Paenibacillus pectinilyticus]|uniref:Flagellar hook-associated protein 2 C-terminal domain-containing protein n=1 Tax=Paenibacillus pectinilyticus TaxID=512399 RepID=A0A1C1A815_9BACL|nr:hypothetical protein [Paenibacillus pectinilyticus]OCT16735.1 hypothetical protein A8709_08725 [Paenibacillus pectinilyticus]